MTTMIDALLPYPQVGDKILFRPLYGEGVQVTATVKKVYSRTLVDLTWSSDNHAEGEEYKVERGEGLNQWSYHVIEA